MPRLCSASLARLSNGEPLVNGKTVTGFANVEEDYADQAMWDAAMLLGRRT